MISSRSSNAFTHTHTHYTISWFSALYCAFVLYTTEIHKAVENQSQMEQYADARTHTHTDRHKDTHRQIDTHTHTDRHKDSLMYLIANPQSTTQTEHVLFAFLTHVNVL